MSEHPDIVKIEKTNTSGIYGGDSSKPVINLGDSSNPGSRILDPGFSIQNQAPLRSSPVKDSGSRIDHRGPYETTWGHVGSSGTIWAHKASCACANLGTLKSTKIDNN